MSAVSCSFPSAHRLNRSEVLAVLKRGKRLSQEDFELRFLISSRDGTENPSRIAIAVPKRLLKSAVARNRIKRLVREEFRSRTATGVSLQLLVTLKARKDGRLADARRGLRSELSALFDEANRRAMSVTSTWCTG